MAAGGLSARAGPALRRPRDGGRRLAGLPLLQRRVRPRTLAGTGTSSGPDGRERKGTHIELTVERLEDGAVSPYLHDEVGVGDKVELRGPFGGWFVWRGDTPVLLVGGGSGVVPLMAMLRYWRQRGEPVPLALVESVRSPDDLFYAGEYGPETTVVHTRVAPAGAERPPGRLDAAILAPLVERLAPAGAVGYVCGSAGFAEHASQLLVNWASTRAPSGWSASGRADASIWCHCRALRARAVNAS